MSASIEIAQGRGLPESSPRKLTMFLLRSQPRICFGNISGISPPHCSRQVTRISKSQSVTFLNVWERFAWRRAKRSRHADQAAIREANNEYSARHEAAFPARAIGVAFRRLPSSIRLRQKRRVRHLSGVAHRGVRLGRIHIDPKRTAKCGRELGRVGFLRSLFAASPPPDHPRCPRRRCRSPRNLLRLTGEHRYGPDLLVRSTRRWKLAGS